MTLYMMHVICDCRWRDAATTETLLVYLECTTICITMTGKAGSQLTLWTCHKEP